MLLYFRNVLDLNSLTQIEVARLAGISDARLSLLLNGHRTANADEREKLLAALESLGVMLDPGRLFEHSRRGVRVLPPSMHVGPPVRC